ncbi:UDP-N-acetylmuramate dehydrogenase [Elusimicrobiota bacterium]
MFVKNGFKLDKLCGYGCGGICDEYIEISDKNELCNLFSGQNKKKWFVIGSGYNTLISDLGVRERVLKLSGDFKEIEVKDRQIAAGAALTLGRLLTETKKNSLSGIEYMAGIPGTVGAAVKGNAGLKTRSILDSIEKIEIFNTASNIFSEYHRSELEFSYRSSPFTDKDIVTEVQFILDAGVKEDIINKIDQQISEKKMKQPVDKKSCGCVFKNPINSAKSAAQLIESVGLAGHKIGNAEISKMHSNYIINNGGAGSKEIWELICMIRSEVELTCGIKLELELNLLGEGFL